MAQSVWDSVPVKYDDPYWQGLASRYAANHGVPEELVLGILLRGEKTNADQVGSKGERGPFQFMPDTRQSFIDKHGIDPWVSPEANAEAAVIHLKESLDKYKDRPEQERMWLAAAEYNGGPSFAKKPAAIGYANRVMAAQTPEQIAMTSAETPSRAGSDFMARVLEFEKTSPTGRALSEIEQREKKIVDYSRSYSKQRKEDISGPPPVPRAIMENYIAGKNNDASNPRRMTPEQINEFERDMRAGLWRVPVPQNSTEGQQAALAEKMARTMAGQDQMTAAAAQAGDWGSLPEMANLSADERIAVMTAPVPEAAQILKAKFPALVVAPDEKGNVIFQSSMDGKTYAAKPGLQLSDLVRFGYRTILDIPTTAIGAGIGAMIGGPPGAFVGGALGTALGETAMQSVQAAQPGGQFNVSDVGTAGVIGGVAPFAVPAVGALARGTVQGAQRVGRMAAEAAQPAVEAVAERVRPMALAAQMAQAAPTPAPATMAPVAVVSRMEQATAPMVEQRLSAMRAAPPGMGAARALPPAPEAADFREAMMRFRQVQAEIPPKLPNAGRLTSVQADEILPLMQRYRDAAEAVGNTQSVRIADEYLALARASMAQPAVVARAQAAPLAAESRVFARAKVEPLKQAIKQVAPDVPEQAADDVAQLAVKAKRSAGEDITDDELVQLVADTAKNGTVGQAAKLKLADMMQLNAEDMVKARLYGFDVPEEFFIDNKRMRALAGLEASQVGTQAEAQLNATVSDALSRSDDILKRFDAVYAEGGPALGAVSDRIGKAMVDEREAIRQEAAPIYKMVDAAMEGKAVRLDNVRNYFAKKLKGASRKVLSKDEKKLLDLVETSSYQKYGDIVAIKNNITSALEKRTGPYKNMADKTLIDLKNAITADQLDNVGSKRIMGEQAEEMRRALRKAHLLTAKQKAFERRLTTLFGKEFQDGMPLGDIEGAIVSALRAPSSGGGIGQLRKLMAKIPEDMKRETLATGFAAAVQRRGGKEAAESGISPAAFITVKNAIDKSTFADEFYRALGPGSKEALDVVHSVMERLWLATGRELKQTGKALQKSLDDSMAAKAVNRMIAETTARQALGVVGAAGGKAIATALRTGDVGRAVGATTGAALANNLMDAITGTRALSKQFINVLKSDEFKKMMVASATGKPLDEPAKVVANSPQFIMYANEMGIDQTPKARLSFINRLFAVSPGAIKAAPMRAAVTEATRMGMEESTVPME